MRDVFYPFHGWGHGSVSILLSGQVPGPTRGHERSIDGKEAVGVCRFPTFTFTKGVFRVVSTGRREMYRFF